MKRYAPFLTLLLLFAGLIAFLVPTVGQVPQTLVVSPPVPAAVPTINKRGTSNVFQLAANTSAATAGTVFCDDGNGNTTTSGCTAGSSITLQTNGTNNGSQSLLNLAQGTGITLADNGTGTVTITGSAAGGANPSCTFSAAATGCATPSAIDVSALAATSINQFLVQCWTGASTTQTALAIATYTYTTGSGIIQTVAPTFVAAAASGYCTANGNGSGGTGGSGSFVLVEEHTASTSAELDFTTCISSTYDDYELRLVNLLPGTNSQQILMQMSTDGGATYDSVAGNYTWAAIYSGQGTGGFYAGLTSGLQVSHAQADNTPSFGGVTAHISLHAPGSSTTYKHAEWHIEGRDARDPVPSTQLFGGMYISTTAVNAFRFISTSGNLTSGTARCYGLSH